MLAGFMDGVGNIIRNSCLADCVEYGEWRSGNRAEGLVFSVNIFKSKVASGLAGAIPAFFLAWIGYVPNVQQGASTLHWIAMFYTVMLGVAALLAVLPLYGYELSENKYAALVRDLDERRMF